MYVKVIGSRVVKQNKKALKVPDMQMMVGQGKSKVSELMLKLETPRKYISFK